MEKIRIGECGYLTVADTGQSQDRKLQEVTQSRTFRKLNSKYKLKKGKPIKLSAMHIDVVNGGELQVGENFFSKVLKKRTF